jgi:hypothetical protein
MSNKFDEPAKGLAPWAAPQHESTRFGALRLLLALPHLASAQTLVPLIPIPTNQISNSSDPSIKPRSKPLLESDEVMHVDPSQITPPPLPAQIIDRSASPNVQMNDPSLDHIQVLPISSLASRGWKFCTQSETALPGDGSNIGVSQGIHVVEVKEARAFNDVELPRHFQWNCSLNYQFSGRHHLIKSLVFEVDRPKPLRFRHFHGSYYSTENVQKPLTCAYGDRLEPKTAHWRNERP